MTISSAKLRQGTAVSGGGASLSDAAPQDLGTAAAGSSADASRADHVHDMPSAADVGADAAGTASSAVSSHAAVTTSVHGISDTANLVYTGDSRLSDSRTPTAHKTSHATGGSDALSPSDIGAAPATGISPSAISGTAVVDSDSRLSDARTPTAHASSHGSAGSDPITVAQSQVTNLSTDLAAKADAADVPPLLIGVACSDETTDLETGTAVVTFRVPAAMTLTGVRASVGTAPTGANLIVDINEGGTSILSTKLSIDAGEKTSTTAATPAVISDTALADDAEITVDVDQVGSTVAGAGLKVWLVGVPA